MLENNSDIKHFVETDLKEYLDILEKPGVFEVQVIPYELLNGSYEGHVWYDTNNGPVRMIDEVIQPLTNYPTPKTDSYALVKIWNDEIIYYEVLQTDEQFYKSLKRVICYSLKKDDDSNVFYIEQEDMFRLNEFASYLQNKQFWYKEPIEDTNIENIIETINNIYLPRIDVSFKLAIMQINAETLPVPKYIKQKTFRKIDKLSCETIIGNIASASDQKAHKYDPIVEAQIPFYKHRFTGVLEPIAKFPFFVIRKHTSIVKNIEELFYCEEPLGEEKAMWIMQKWVKEQRSFLICGSMGSGKTTLLNSNLKLANRYNPQNRIGIIEDTPEVICSSENYYALNCGSGIVNNSKLLRTSFRLTPKQIVVGEIRGPEAYEFLDAASGGCECCMATIHAGGAMQALYRFESCLKMNPLVEKINRTQIAMSINGVISIQRVIIRKEVNGIWQTSSKRRITSIMNVKGYDPRFDFYEHDYPYQDKELLSLTADGTEINTKDDFRDFTAKPVMSPSSTAQSISDHPDNTPEINNTDDFKNFTKGANNES